MQASAVIVCQISYYVKFPKCYFFIKIFYRHFMSHSIEEWAISSNIVWRKISVLFVTSPQSSWVRRVWGRALTKSTPPIGSDIPS